MNMTTNKQLKLIPRGVYLNMPSEQYHAEPSLSYSGIKAVTASPLTYWHEFLDPDREEESSKPAQIMGEAIHKIILEGTEAFNRVYLAEPKPEDYPGCLQGVEALREKCGELGLKKSGTLEEMSLRILDIEPNCLLWPVIKRAFQDDVAAGNKKVLSQDVYQQCLRAKEAFQSNDAAKAARSGGLPEVSVFWETQNGIPMKARIDCLKPRAIVDLKTFNNQNGVPIDSAVVYAVTKYQYHVQAYVYMQAARAAKELILNGCVYGDNAQALQQFARVQEDPRFYFVFLETGPATNVLVREFVQSQGDVMSLVWEKGERITTNAIAVWQQYMRMFGPDKPWVTNQPARPFVDEEFPIWATE